MRLFIPTAFFRRLALVVAASAAVAPAAAQDEYYVSPHTIEDQKSVYATVQAIDTTTARARIAGTIVDLAVDEGSAVKEGQVIARILDAKLALGLKAIDSRIQAMRSRAKLADVELERTRTLLRKGTVSQARLDKAETARKVLGRDLSAMQAERAVIAQRQVEGRVLAPAAGRVLRVNVTKGNAVQAGDTIATITANAFVLRLQLPERHARLIKRGETVRLDRARSGSVTKGVVRQVYPEIRHGRVVADVDVPGLGLGNFFVGERIKVQISAGARQGFLVPAKYLFRRFGLTFGAMTEGGVEILSGLRPGDRLVMPPQERKEKP